MSRSVDCEIRLLMQEHLAAYKTLRDGMLAAHPEAFTSDYETESRREAASYRARLTGGSVLFTLGAWLDGDPKDGRLVGAITAEREPRQKVQHVAHIVGMMVADDMQGQGVGRTLLDCALRLLRGEDTLELVTLSVTASNTGAVRLYERCGFTRYGRLEDAIKLADGTRRTKDLMALRLR